MRLSELDYDKLTENQKIDLVVKNISYSYTGLIKDKKYSTAILVLGARADSVKERILTAIELLKRGYGSHIIVSDDFEPSIDDTAKTKKDLVKESKIHEEQKKMIYEIADIYQIAEKKMLYFSDDLDVIDEKIKQFDKYIVITLLPNVRRAVQRFTKVYPNKKFVGCATKKDLSEWDMKIEDTKDRYIEQIIDEAKYLIDYTKKGFLADMNVDFIFEEEKK